MATFQDLAKQKEAIAQQLAALERQIAEQQSAEKAGAVEKVKAIMSEYGLTIADLQDTGAKRGRKPGAKSASSGKTVAAKYKDSNSNSWSGRGLKPKWLTAALAEGKKIEDFAI